MQADDQRHRLLPGVAGRGVQQKGALLAADVDGEPVVARRGSLRRLFRPASGEQENAQDQERYGTPHRSPLVAAGRQIWRVGHCFRQVNGFGRRRKAGRLSA
jgi:hypothetical protein